MLTALFVAAFAVVFVAAVALCARIITAPNGAPKFSNDKVSLIKKSDIRKEALQGLIDYSNIYAEVGSLNAKQLATVARLEQIAKVSLADLL